MNLTPKINCIEFKRYEMYGQQLVGNTSTTRPYMEMTGISTCSTAIGVFRNYAKLAMLAIEASIEKSKINSANKVTSRGD